MSTQGKGQKSDRRAKPAVYFAGKSRIVDFALSNSINSGIRRIAVATQFMSHGLIRHLHRGWNFLRPERNESFDVLPASQRTPGAWYPVGMVAGFDAEYDAKNFRRTDRGVCIVTQAMVDKLGA